MTDLPPKVKARFDVAWNDALERKQPTKIPDVYKYLLSVEKQLYESSFYLEDVVGKLVTQVNSNTSAMKEMKRELDECKTAMSAKTEELEGTKQELIACKAQLEQKLAGADGAEAQDVKKLVDEAIKPYKDTVNHQQRSLEFLEGRNREKNLVVTGISEKDGNNADEQDRNEVDAVMVAIGCPGIAPAKVSRLGKKKEERADDLNMQAPQRPRPIMISLETVAETKTVLDHCKKLANIEKYKKVYVKRDTHPMVRKEWARLRSLVKTEKEAPVNIGCDIKLDYKAKAVTRDGAVIARFKSPFRN